MSELPEIRERVAAFVPIEWDIKPAERVTYAYGMAYGHEQGLWHIVVALHLTPQKGGLPLPTLTWEREHQVTDRGMRAGADSLEFIKECLWNELLETVERRLATFGLGKETVG